MPGVFEAQRLQNDLRQNGLKRIARRAFYDQPYKIVIGVGVSILLPGRRLQRKGRNRVEKRFI